jgi:hypothetical protein
MERAPAVSVNVIGVAADADGAYRSTADNAKAVLAAPRNFVFITAFPTFSWVWAENELTYVSHENETFEPDQYYTTFISG